MADLNELSAQEIGRRLRIARENADVRQDDAAQVIGMSRPTLVSIEKGVRRVRIQEIQTLARHYGLSVNALLRREAVHTDLMPRFRKLRETEDAHTTEAVQLFNDLIKADVEMENILGIHAGGEARAAVLPEEPADVAIALQVFGGKFHVQEKPTVTRREEWKNPGRPRFRRAGLPEFHPPSAGFIIQPVAMHS